MTRERMGVEEENGEEVRKFWHILYSGVHSGGLLRVQNFRSDPWNTHPNQTKSHNVS